MPRSTTFVTGVLFLLNLIAFGAKLYVAGLLLMKMSEVATFKEDSSRDTRVSTKSQPRVKV